MRRWAGTRFPHGPGGRGERLPRAPHALPGKHQNRSKSGRPPRPTTDPCYSDASPCSQRGPYPTARIAALLWTVPGDAGPLWPVALPKGPSATGSGHPLCRLASRPMHHSPRAGRSSRLLGRHARATWKQGAFGAPRGRGRHFFGSREGAGLLRDIRATPLMQVMKRAAGL